MLDISVIILTYNEEIHIRRCIENVKPFVKNIFVVDSFSTDATCEIAKSLGAKVYQNKWPGNHADQFNWALENLSIDSEWVLRLDADEYLMPELIEEIQNRLPLLDSSFTGIIFKRRHIFFDRWIKKGTYPVKLLRMFRYRKAICEQRLMDEHIELLEGKCIEFEYDFADHNLNNTGWWTTKHNGYSIREAIELLDIEYGLIDKIQRNGGVLSDQANKKRNLKHSYAKKPLFFRSFVYFIYRYFFRFGFLDGKEGFLWHFLQGWWYRTLVDAKIFEIKKACGNDKVKIKQYILSNYGIDLNK